MLEFTPLKSTWFSDCSAAPGEEAAGRECSGAADVQADAAKHVGLEVRRFVVRAAYPVAWWHRLLHCDVGAKGLRQVAQSDDLIFHLSVVVKKHVPKFEASTPSDSDSKAR